MNIQESTLKEIREQIKQLKDIERMILEREKAKAIADIKSKIHKFNLSYGDIYDRTTKSRKTIYRNRYLV
ncbi:MAG TPA: hypothetical protein ENN50_06875 [Prosthecochloris aestuarii]|uniref:Uncharacterized protein n=1 Tax=Prosthecochloris aestuarii TaxID=1102 RepID=A0A831WPB0_PROAE|nr:hypothetical protein [Prosthecochloris aestuarii]